MKHQHDGYILQANMVNDLQLLITVHSFLLYCGLLPSLFYNLIPVRDPEWQGLKASCLGQVFPWAHRYIKYRQTLKTSYCFLRNKGLVNVNSVQLVCSVYLPYSSPSSPLLSTYLQFVPNSANFRMNAGTFQGTRYI
jgi:hypothetical protein